MPAAYKLNVPAKAADVTAFLNENRPRFLNDLSTVMGIIRDRQTTDPRLRCIYKIYSRSEAQAGEELKHPRKVRLKFDRFHAGKGSGPFSLYDSPDIVGFTVVVSYPGDISQVCEVIDGLIDAGVLRPTVPVIPDPNSTIRSRHGRVMESGGYVACHYNVRTPGPVPRPVIEVQIKTVLHDAWGHKTHDLVYKPAGRFDQALLDSFNHLGDMLAQIDLQSDTLRRSLERAFRARSLKRRRVQLESLKEVIREPLLARAPAGAGGASIQALGTRMRAYDGADPDIGQQLVDGALELIEQHPETRSYTCPMVCWAAVMTGDPRHEAHAQEALEIWEQDTDSERDKIKARGIAALAAFAFGRVSEAIDLAEQAVAGFEALALDTLAEDDRKAAIRLASSTYSSLAYYHADMVGSHEGVHRQSVRKAREAMAHCAPLWKTLGLPADGLLGDQAGIEAALGSPGASTIFQTLDSEGFVRIQTAETESELKSVFDRLRWLHERVPAEMSDLASPLWEFHDFCARKRLSELETDG